MALGFIIQVVYNKRVIIDAHTHISYIRKKKSFLKIKGELLLNMKKNRIAYSVVIPDNLPNTNCADLDNLINLVKKEPRLYAIGTLKINLVDKKNISKINKLFKDKTTKGFKIFPGHDPVYPTDSRWFPIYRLCIKHNLPLVIHTGINVNNKSCAKYNDPKYIVKVAKKFPKLKIIISHYFWPKLDYCFNATNGFNNIYFDTSALADSDVIKASGGIKKIKDILTKTVKRNPGSVLFGTDWPICNVKKHIDLVNSLAVSKEEKEKVFYKNSLEIFGLKS